MDAYGRFSHDEFGCKADVVGIGFVGALDTFDEELCGGCTHLIEGLAHGGEARVEVFGDDDVVESDDGDVVRTGEAGVLNGADRSDGGGVVEAEEGGEVTGGSMPPEAR